MEETPKIRTGVGLYKQIDYSKVKAQIPDENGNLITVSGKEYMEYYKPENTEERCRRLTLYINNPEFQKKLEEVNEALGKYLNITKDGKSS